MPTLLPHAGIEPTAENIDCYSQIIAARLFIRRRQSYRRGMYWARLTGGIPVRDVLLRPDAFAVFEIPGAPTLGQRRDELQAASAFVRVGCTAHARGREAAVVNLAG